MQQIEGEQQCDVGPEPQSIYQPCLWSVPLPYEKFVAYFHATLFESTSPSARSHLVQNLRISTADHLPIRTYSQRHL